MMTGTSAIPTPIRPPAELPLAFLDQVALWGQAYLPVLLDKFHIPPAEVAVQLRHPHVKALLRERQDYWRHGSRFYPRVGEKNQRKPQPLAAKGIPTVDSRLVPGPQKERKIRFLD